MHNMHTVTERKGQRDRVRGLRVRTYLIPDPDCVVSGGIGYGKGGAGMAEGDAGMWTHEDAKGVDKRAWGSVVGGGGGGAGYKLLEKWW